MAPGCPCMSLLRTHRIILLPTPRLVQGPAAAPSATELPSCFRTLWQAALEGPPQDQPHTLRRRWLQEQPKSHTVEAKKLRWRFCIPLAISPSMCLLVYLPIYLSTPPEHRSPALGPPRTPHRSRPRCHHPAANLMRAQTPRKQKDPTIWLKGPRQFYPKR